MIKELLRTLLTDYISIIGVSILVILVLGGLALPFDKPAPAKHQPHPMWAFATPRAFKVIYSIFLVGLIGYSLGSIQVRLISVLALSIWLASWLGWFAVGMFKHGYVPEIGFKVGVGRSERPVRYWMTSLLFAFLALALLGAGAIEALRT